MVFPMNDVGLHHSFNIGHSIRQTPAHTSGVSTCVVCDYFNFNFYNIFGVLGMPKKTVSIICVA